MEEKQKMVYAASLVRAKKVKGYGVINQERGILTITDLSVISDSKGRFDEKKIIVEAKRLSEAGFVIQIEDTKGGLIANEFGTVLLQDRDYDGRSKRDVKFDQYLRLKQSGKLIIDPSVRVHEPNSDEYRIETDPNSGKTRYVFEYEFDGDFRVALLLCGLVFGQPMDETFIDEMKEKMIENIDIDNPENLIKQLNQDINGA